MITSAAGTNVSSVRKQHDLQRRRDGADAVDLAGRDCDGGAEPKPTRPMVSSMMACDRRPTVSGRSPQDRPARPSAMVTDSVRQRLSRARVEAAGAHELAALATAVSSASEDGAEFGHERDLAGSQTQQQATALDGDDHERAALAERNRGLDCHGLAGPPQRRTAAQEPRRAASTRDGDDDREDRVCR